MKGRRNNGEARFGLDKRWRSSRVAHQSYIVTRIGGGSVGCSSACGADAAVGCVVQAQGRLVGLAGWSVGW